jgi:hypothetical protein
MKRLRHRPRAPFLHDRQGGSAVEFAFVSIPLFLFLFGILEFGRAIWVDEALQSAASKTARCVGLKLSGPSGCTGAACGCWSSGAYSSSLTTSYAQALAQSWGVTLPATTAAINVTTTATTACGGSATGSSFAQVTLSYTFSTVAANLIPPLKSKALSAVACFPMSS